MVKVLIDENKLSVWQEATDEVAENQEWEYALVHVRVFRRKDDHSYTWTDQQEHYW